MKKKSNVKRRNIIIACILLIILILAIYLKETKKYEVETSVVDSGKIEKLIEEIAEVKSNNRLIIHSKVAGTVKETLVSEGDLISVGDAIVNIDQRDIDYEIETTKVLIDSMDAEFKEAIKPADKNKLAIAENNVKSAKASVDQSKISYENDLKLFESGSISENELDNSRVNYEILNVNYENANAQLSIIKKGTSSNISDKFNLEIENLNLRLKQLESMRNDYNIKSTVDAWVTENYVDVGDYIMVGSKVVELMDIKNIYLQAEVLDSDAINISKGTKVNIIFENLIYDGIVEKIYPKAYNKVSDLGIVQKRIKVDIKIQGDDTILKLGQEVDVQFVEDVVENDIRIFKDYIYDFENKKFVLVLDNGLIVEREVKLGLEGEDYYQVLDGLLDGEKIITNFADDLVIGKAAVEK